jgi:hypothetical protein
MVRVCQDLSWQAFFGVLDGIPSGNDPCLSLGVAHNTTKSLDLGKTGPEFPVEIGHTKVVRTGFCGTTEA